MIHVQIWSGSHTARITDMTNAGKRGKKCAVLRFAGVPWNARQGNDLQQLAGQWSFNILYAIGQLRDGTYPQLPGVVDVAFGTARAIVMAEVANARGEGVPENYVACYDEEIRGVDAPVPVLTHCVEGVFGAAADENGVSLAAHNDPYNEWREITAHGQKDSQAYRLAAKVWPQVRECRTLGEASKVLRQAGCKLHGYCAID